MKKKFLLYVSSVMCLSLSIIQISNAMQSDSNHSASSSTSSKKCSSCDYYDRLLKESGYSESSIKSGAYDLVEMFCDAIKANKKEHSTSLLAISEDYLNYDDARKIMSESFYCFSSRNTNNGKIDYFIIPTNLSTKMFMRISEDVYNRIESSTVGRTYIEKLHQIL